MSLDPSEIVYVVDDDPAVLNALTEILAQEKLTVKGYSSADQCLDALSPDCLGCLILDLNMPGTNGLQLQQRLLEQGISLPIVFISGQGKVSSAVEAMKKGAVEFLEKPFTREQILQAAYRALEIGRIRRSRQQQLRKVRQRIAELSNREVEVMNLLVAGDPTKVIAETLNISPRTAEIHRLRVMNKMQARTLAQLVQMVLLTRES